MTDPVKAYGWTAMPRKVETLLSTRTDIKPPAPVSVNDVTLPGSPLVKAVHEYAKKELAPETFNHSMRVYYYGMHLTSNIISSSPPTPYPVTLT
jgi:cyanamide hydratase